MIGREDINMTRNILLSGLVALGLLSTGAVVSATEDGMQMTDHDFSFEGPFGSYDEAKLQGALQVYAEICSACQGFKFVPIRVLHDHGDPAELPAERKDQ